MNLKIWFSFKTNSTWLKRIDSLVLEELFKNELTYDELKIKC